MTTSPKALILNSLSKHETLVSTLDIDIDIDTNAVRMPIARKHTGAPGIAHGGSVMALLDTALGVRAIDLALQQGKATSTVELKVNFLRPGKLGSELHVETDVEFVGRSLMVIRGAALDDEQRKIAVAVGTFNLYEVDAGRMADALRSLEE